MPVCSSHPCFSNITAGQLCPSHVRRRSSYPSPETERPISCVRKRLWFKTKSLSPAPLCSGDCQQFWLKSRCILGFPSMQQQTAGNIICDGCPWKKQICTNIAFSSSTPYSLERSLTRRRRPLVTPSRVWWQPVTLRRSLVPCRAPRFCSAGVGVQGQTVGSAREGRAVQAQPLALVLGPSSTERSGTVSALVMAQIWVTIDSVEVCVFCRNCWGFCSLNTLTRERLSLNSNSVTTSANEAAVLVEVAGKITQPCPLSQPNPAQLQENSGFYRDSAEPAFNWKTKVVTKLHFKK